MATHPRFLDWRIPMDRGAWWATVHRIARSWTGCTHPFLLLFSQVLLIYLIVAQVNSANKYEKNHNTVQLGSEPDFPLRHPILSFT